MLRDARNANLSEAVCLMSCDRLLVASIVWLSVAVMMGSEEDILVVISMVVCLGGHIAVAKDIT